MIKPKVVLLIFVSGKIVLTGAKVSSFYMLIFFRNAVLTSRAGFVLIVHLQVREEIYTAFNTIYTVLLEFRKP